MTLTKALTLILFPVLVLSCSNANQKTGKTSTGESGGTASSGNASFSAIIDGVKVTGAGIDDMQLQNTAFIYPDNKKGKKLIFFLYSTKDGDDATFNYSFRFDTPDQIGEFTNTPGKDEMVNLMLNMNIHNGNLARYFGNSIKLHITTLTATRVAGTFSGLFKLGPDTPRADKQEVSVTDGTFDIPFSTGNLKPE